ncbi:MAG: peptide deformylase [Bacteroidales bacterium]|nr:peptide deformylase [Bacteroidales bacterium]
MKPFFSWLMGACALSGACGGAGAWTEAERALLSDPAPVMRVLTLDSPEDSLRLRGESVPLSAEALRSDEYRILSEKLLATVRSPEQDGVGLAAPQVGILRRVVAVQRFDKAGEPFEVYPNIRITAVRGELASGAEGCLSVPGRRGDVLRYRDIDIAYTSLQTLCDTTERVQGFTAVIFQHECDHLDGVLYIDKL